MRIALALCVLALTSTSSWGAGLSSSCREELGSYCGSEHGFLDRLRCLEGKRAKLSAPCKEALDREHAEGESFRSDCKAEIGGSCLNLQGRALMECLERLGDKLAKPCADRVAGMHAERRSRHERIPAACREDAEKSCGGAVSGGINACLKANAEKISKSCKDALK